MLSRASRDLRVGLRRLTIDLIADLRVGDASPAAEMVAGREEAIIHDLASCEDSCSESLSRKIFEATTLTANAIGGLETGFVVTRARANTRFSGIGLTPHAVNSSGKIRAVII